MPATKDPLPLENKVALTVYHYPPCSTCRNALAWLAKHKLPVTSIDIVKAPPSKTLLKKLLKLSGLPLQRFFNTSGELYRDMGLKHKLPTMTEDAALTLLSKHGKLIKRPLAFSADQVTVGFKEPEFTVTWR